MFTQSKLLKYNVTRTMNKAKLGHSQSRLMNNSTNSNTSKPRHLYKTHKGSITLGPESPCRQPHKPTSRFKYLDLLFWKKGIKIADSRWDKVDYYGIEKLHKDYTPPECIDEYNFKEPKAKRSWWHRPYYYRSFPAFLVHRDNFKKFKHSIANILVFKGDKNRETNNILLESLKDGIRHFFKRSHTITQQKLNQVVSYLQYLKEDQNDIPIYDSDQILPIEKDILNQAMKIRLAWREDWKDFWRHNPPLEDWETPRGLADPDAHIPLDYNDSVFFNDIVWGGSGQEDILQLVLRWKKSKNPIDLIKLIILWDMVEDGYLDKLIEIRESERRRRFQLGSINRGAMDVVIDYIPGWNHSTHTYDYGRRTSMYRTMREEENLMARYPDPMNKHGRVQSIPPHMEMLFQWRAFPDPVYSKFSHINAQIHAFQMHEYLSGEVESSKEGIPDHLLKEKGSNEPKHWLYMFSAKEGYENEVGYFPTVMDTSSHYEGIADDPEILSYIANETPFGHLIGADDNARVSHTTSELKKAFTEKRASIPKWKIRLLSNPDFLNLVVNTKSTLFPANRRELAKSIIDIFKTHIPELITGKKKIPESIKKDIKESVKEVMEKKIIDMDKLKYVNQKRKSKELNNDLDKRSYSTSSKDYQNNSSWSDKILGIFSKSSEFNRIEDTLKYDVDPNQFEHIDLRIPKISLNQSMFPQFSVKDTLMNSIERIIGPEVPPDSFNIEMEFIAKQRTKQIKKVLFDISREIFMKNSRTVRRFESTRVAILDYMKPLLGKISLGDTYDGNIIYSNPFANPEKGITKEYLDYLAGSKTNQMGVLQSILEEPTVRAVLYPSQKETITDYKILREQIDHQVLKKLEKRKVDEAEYFLEYVQPFFDILEKDPKNLKKKQFLLLRLHEYTTLIPRNPMDKSDIEETWDKLFEEHEEVLRARELENEVLRDPRFDDYNLGTMRVMTLEERLSQVGIFINSFTRKLYPMRQNRWHHNIVYGPDGAPFDISQDADLHKLQGIVDSMKSAQRAIENSKSLFWMKQIRKLHNISDPEDIDGLKSPDQLLNIFLKHHTQLYFEKHGKAKTESEILKVEEDIETKKAILEKNLTMSTLILALQDKEFIKSIRDKKIQSHSGKIHLEKSYSKDELFIILFLRSCIDGSIKNYPSSKKEAVYVEPSEKLYNWLYEHYTSMPDTLEIQHSLNQTEHRKIRDDMSLTVPFFDTGKFNMESYYKAIQFLQYFNSLRPAEWFLGMRLLKEDPSIAKDIENCLDLVNRVGAPDSDKYIDTLQFLIEKGKNLNPGELRQDYIMQLDKLKGVIRGIAEEYEDERVLEDDTFTDIGEKMLDLAIPKYQVHKIPERPHPPPNFQPTPEFAVELARRDYEKRKQEAYILGVPFTETNPFESNLNDADSGKSIHNGETHEEDIISTEQKLEEEEKTIEQVYSELNEEEKQMLFEIFDDQNLETMYMEKRDEYFMNLAGVVPYHPGLSATQSGFPYDYRDVYYSPSDYGLTDEERNDPELMRAFTLNDPTIFDIVKKLKTIEKYGHKYGGASLLIAEVLCEEKANLDAGSDYKVLPRMAPGQPYRIEGLTNYTFEYMYMETALESKTARRRAMGYDPFDFVFDTDAAIDGENPLNRRSSVTNKPLNSFELVDEIPFKGDEFQPETLGDVLQFEIDLRKSLSEKITPETRNAIKSQYDQFLKTLKEGEKVEEIEPVPIEEEGDDHSHPYSAVHKLVLGAEEEEEYEEEEIELEKIIEEEIKTPEVKVGGLVIAKPKKEETASKGLASIEEKDKSLGATTKTVSEDVRKVVGTGLFKTFGFGNKAKAQQDANFLKLMKIVIPGFRLESWLKANRENILYVIRQLKRNKLNFIRLIASESTYEEWLTNNLYADKGVKHTIIIFSNAYVLQDIPMCEYTLVGKFGKGKRRGIIRIKMVIKIDYKSKNFFFIDSWNGIAKAANTMAEKIRGRLRKKNRIPRKVVR